MNTFERLYSELRAKEQRIYSDTELSLLPEIDSKHVHYKEWKIREQSARQLIAYLSKRKEVLNLLEVGCGNGWLAAKLAEINKMEVTGIDVSRTEVAQAKRVFKKNNLQFKWMHFEAEEFNETKFDVIVFAAAIQYFPSLKKTIKAAQQCLAKGGEIHILDTHFYNGTNLKAAILRTEAYYQQSGYNELDNYYFHHLWTDLNEFNFKILFNPKTIVNRLTKRSPFYWICINETVSISHL
ncbi:MAG: class I SAM-dependent methyltransferase [Bacteroidota bacterium]